MQALDEYSLDKLVNWIFTIKGEKKRHSQNIFIVIWKTNIPLFADNFHNEHGRDW